MTDERITGLRACPVCNGPAQFEQIDSSVGVLTTAECTDQNCGSHNTQPWFSNESNARAWWNRGFPSSDQLELLE